MPSMHYAGIGTGQAPDGVREIALDVARRLWRLGYALRVGGAAGEDFAFEIGAPENKIVIQEDQVWVSQPSVVGNVGSGSARKVEYMPGDVFFMESKVKEHHPHPYALRGAARKRMRRGALHVLGYKRPGLELPQVDFVVCWAPDGSIDDAGELGHVLRLARHYNIPVFNLEPDAAGCLDRLWVHLREIDVRVEPGGQHGARSSGGASVNDTTHGRAPALVERSGAAEATGVMAHLGARLRRAREDAGITQQQVADHLGKSRPYVTRAEGGMNTTVDALAAWAAFLGLEVELVSSRTAQAGQR
jgi:hypothetical protein